MSEEEEPELSENSSYETPEESDEEAAVARIRAEALASPRRQSGRRRGAPRRPLKESSSSSSEGEEEEGGGESGSEGERSKSAQRSPAKPARRPSFVVVKEEPSAGSRIQLPKLTAVPVEWPAGDDALCTVCGDGEDADGCAGRQGRAGWGGTAACSALNGVGQARRCCCLW